MQDGTILGIGMNNKLYTRADLNAKWVMAPNVGGKVKGVVSIMKDGTILGLAMDGSLLTRVNLDAKWVKAANCGKVKAITIMQGGIILGVGMNNKLYTRATLYVNWAQAPDAGGQVTGVTPIMQDGTILGIALDGSLVTRSGLNAKWVKTPDMGGQMKAVAIMQDGTILGVDMEGNLCPTNLDVKPPPETIRIAVGKAMNPQRIMIAQAVNSNYTQSEWGPDSEKKMDINGFEHQMELWASPLSSLGLSVLQLEVKTIRLV